MRILIIGGYGVFGSRLVELLADRADLTLIIAGRSLERAEALTARTQAEATLVPAVIDRNGDLVGQFALHTPKLIVDASGPFQNYGSDPYKVVEAAIELGINYLDLADGSDFVRGITAFDDRAKQNGVYVLAGASSFPVLTAAVVRHLAYDLERVETITAGIAPSPYAGIGLNVIRAIASYAGKPVRLTREGRPSLCYGLTEARRYTIAPPGKMPLDNRLFSLVDAPELQLLPDVWPGVRSVWTGAGPVPAILHRLLITMSWAVRLRLLPSLAFGAPLFHWAINRIRWGEHRGGMFVEIEGIDRLGHRSTRSWQMLAEGNDGPYIPSMAIAAIVGKGLAGEWPTPGARTAINALEVENYEDVFRGRRISYGVRDDTERNADRPLFHFILGRSWEALPEPVRAVHDVTDGVMRSNGTAEVRRGRNLMSRLVGGLFGFPKAAQSIPVSVEMRAEGTRETWIRQFGTQQFKSTLYPGSGRSDRLINERFGVFEFSMALVLIGERLEFVVRRWKFLGLPLPLALAPRVETHETAEDGQFRFNVEIRLPIFGLLVHYRGHLTPEIRDGDAAAPALDTGNRKAIA
ncbi:MAG: DUF4166 domain-containing protein [Hyphomicrobiaceae bacterium]